ncbi:MAG TPA: GNAT family N-acetyltransferase [Candidatus Absconditabacterales bacterium]|nr:GNAT family N-acetyltransferase [Candidatus Absconditabacterales bacterium]
MEKSTTIQEIITPNLQWELLSKKYIQEIFKELTDEVTKYLRVATPQKIEEEEQWIIRSKEKFDQGLQMNFIVTDTEGDFIGTCGIMDLNTPTPELGLWIKKSARGKGYGKEMIGSLINRLQTHKKIDYIIYRAHTENLGSRKIAEHFGGEIQLDEEGKEKIFIEHKFDNSSSFEIVEYRIYKK